MSQQVLILKGSPRQKGNSAVLAEDVQKQTELMEKAYQLGQQLGAGR